MKPVRELAAGTDLLAMHDAWPERYPFLLESVEGTNAQARYDLLFALPGESLRLEAGGRLVAPADVPVGAGFLDSLDLWWARERTGLDEGPFAGGWFLYLGYELAAEIEPGLRLTAPAGLPVALATRVRGALIRDRQSGRTRAVVEPGSEEGLERMAADAGAAHGDADAGVPALAGPAAEEPPEDYLAAVAAAKARIAAGDVYQANLSRLWHGRLAAGMTPSNIYRRLRRANPAPFAGLMRVGEHSVISSSPERLLRLADGIASTRPIAGTRPRGASRQDDRALSAELLAHPKERAEHVMLIDLERNDLGRICRPGTVRVDEMMSIETYRHVHHIVSNVTGELEAGVTPGRAIGAVFPGGTITGCPKVRCMQIIAELESGPRGAYTGSFGYLSRDGSLDLNILIRTVVTDGTEMTLRAGAGIVADSEPERELAETRAKAKGLLLALGQGQGHEQGQGAA
ncbi:aminodeoxychorismate synthase component I [Lentisalinibacter salinarum]|uniref:aminodeoxychorismate synthase component I n=1 Tax=Lentisalinibacter salinarum TaxID=2992239 RepID=UPI0038656C13